mmetsp:Transcript_16904/g.36585  ORF Transcript_16904/g.36585 Transcript_16904/m.36585 type:complete len:371 (+) Transcript_16904:2164-3276(+)
MGRPSWLCDMRIRPKLLSVSSTMTCPEGMLVAPLAASCLRNSSYCVALKRWKPGFFMASSLRDARAAAFLLSFSAFSLALRSRMTFMLSWSSSRACSCTMPSPVMAPAEGSVGSRSSSRVVYLLGSGVFLMWQARLAYLRVLLVSSKSISLGLMQLMSTVKLLPPRESCSRRVSLESLYGTCPFFLPSTSVDNATMTLPSASRPLLMWVASFSSLPVTPERLTRSLPARSTKCSLLVNSEVRTRALKSSPSSFSTSTMVRWMVIVKIACEREDLSFSLVLLVLRFSMHSSKNFFSSSAVSTFCSLTPTTSGTTRPSLPTGRSCSFRPAPTLLASHPLFTSSRPLLTLRSSRSSLYNSSAHADISVFSPGF